MKTLNELQNDIQKLREKSYLFMLPKMVLILWKMKRLNQKTTRRLNLYVSLNELPLDCFIDCIIDKKFERQIKTGTAYEHELLSNWENIFIEYCEKTNTVDYKTKFKLQKELGINQSKLLIIETCILTLSYAYSKKCIEILENLGYKYEFDYKNSDLFIKDLERVVQNKKSIELDLLTIRKKLSEIELKEANQPKISREYYENYLTVLAKWKQVVVIRASEITVSDFVSMSNLYNSEMTKQSVRNGK